MGNKQITVLVVEDEKYIMKLLIKRLHEAKFNVLKATDGEEGLNIALREHPDLILLDILMPGVDGISMTKELRKDEWGEKAPIIFLTNLCSKREEAYALGADDYIIKSNINLDTLVDLINKKINK